MNISDVNASTHRSDHLNQSNVGGIDPAAKGRDVSEQQRQENADRIEISEQAQEALSKARTSDELTFARKALHSVPEMSAERTAEIQDRIKSGYYNRADVIENVADRLSTELSRGA